MLDPLRAHAAQVPLVGIDELGLRAVGLNGLAMKPNARQNRVERLGSDTALERCFSDFAEEGLKSLRLDRRVAIKLLGSIWLSASWVGMSQDGEKPAQYWEFHERS